ncbi:cuticle protein 65-like [Diorhabda sublineata]|uniref:cuticle protein 65-like n=1 Tax=Diorhabda sublineata TaxID=1163346 RepID=UPI0024E0C996|nr:cuticle protein 65-like [Diorhabda sublineata]
MQKSKYICDRSKTKDLQLEDERQIPATEEVIFLACLIFAVLTVVSCGETVDNKKTKRGLLGLGYGSGFGHLGSGNYAFSGGYGLAGYGGGLGLARAGSSLSLGGYGYGGDTSSHTVTTINRPVAVPYPQPVPVRVDRPVAVPVPHPVPVDVPRPYPVPVPQPYPVTVTRTVPVEVPRAVPVPHPVPVPISIPQPVAVGVSAPAISFGSGLGFGGGYGRGYGSTYGSSYFGHGLDLGFGSSKGIVLGKGW